MTNNTHVVKNLRSAVRSSLNMAGNTAKAIRQDRFEARLENQGQDTRIDHGQVTTDRDSARERDPLKVRQVADLNQSQRKWLESFGIKQWVAEDFEDPARIAKQVLLSLKIVEQSGDAPGQEAMRKEVMEASTELAQTCPGLVFPSFKSAVKAAVFPALDAEWLSAARQAADRQVIEALRRGVVDPDLEAKAESLAEREASSLSVAPVAGVIARGFAWAFDKDVLALVQGNVLEIIGARKAKKAASAVVESREDREGRKVGVKPLSDQAWETETNRWRNGLAILSAQVTAALDRLALPAGKLVLHSPDGSMYGVESSEEAEAKVLSIVEAMPGVIEAAARWSKNRSKLQVTMTWDRRDEFSDENEVTTSVWGITPHPGKSTTMKGCYTCDQSGRKVVAGIVECPVEDVQVVAAVAKASVDAVKAGPDRSFEVGGVTYVVFDL